MIGLPAWTQTSVELKVSNDMTYFTDRYFSNGIELTITGNFASGAKFWDLLLPGGEMPMTSRSFTVKHNMYTPSDTYTPELLDQDYPYSAYFLVGVKKQSVNPSQHLKTIAALEMGYMGPLAGGEAFQNSMHSVISIAEHVEGWHNQMRNDVCLQYTLGIEKGLLSMQWLEVNAFMTGRLGSPHTDAAMGSSLRIGIIDPYFKHLGLNGPGNLRIWGFCAADARFVCYDATLHGGLNNRHNPYSLDEIYPLYWHFLFGGTLSWKKIRIELAQEVVSPQFSTMMWHRWAYIALMVGF
jgi:hypothetical protein